MGEKGFTLHIESCRDCPRHRAKTVRTIFTGGFYATTHYCTQEGRYIKPRDGMKPPPDWCPKREEG